MNDCYLEVSVSENVSSQTAMGAVIAAMGSLNFIRPVLCSSPEARIDIFTSKFILVASLLTIEMVPTFEVLRLGIVSTSEDRHLRPSAELSANRRAVRIAQQSGDGRCIQMLRCLAILDPIHQLVECAGRKCARTAEAMLHTGDFVVAEEIAYFWDERLDTLEIVGGTVRRDQLVTESVPGNQLASCSLKEAEVGICRVHDGVVLLSRDTKEVVEEVIINFVQVKIGVFEQEMLDPVRRDREWFADAFLVVLIASC